MLIQWNCISPTTWESWEELQLSWEGWRLARQLLVPLALPWPHLCYSCLLIPGTGMAAGEQAAPAWGSQAAVPHLLQTLLPAALPCPEQLPQFTAQMANVAQGKVPSTGAMS